MKQTVNNCSYIIKIIFKTVHPKVIILQVLFFETYNKVFYISLADPSEFAQNRDNTLTMPKISDDFINLNGNLYKRS